MNDRKVPSPKVFSIWMRRALASLAACAFLYAAAMCGWAQDDSSGSANETIRGTVVNSVTGEGIPRALVYSPDNRYATLTDGQGHFEFSAPKASPVPPGDSFSTGPSSVVMTTRARYILFARKPGFIEETDQRAVAPVGTDLTIPLVPEAIIRGRIAISDSDAAAGITVELLERQVQNGRFRWMRARSVRANSNGEFRFAELRPGGYKVMTAELLDTDPAETAPRGQMFGFAPACFPGVPDFASGQLIQVSAGQVFEADIALKRQPYFRVQIPVANSAEGFGMNVRVLAQGHPGPGYSLGYNSNTQRIEGMLPKGSYLVEAASFGPSLAGGTVNLSVTGNMIDGPTLTMIPGTSIPVNVREEFSSTDWDGTASFRSGDQSFTVRGGPRTYLNVWLDPADDFNNRGGSGLRPPRSANDSALAIESAQPGRYWVRVNAARGYVGSLTSGTADLLHEPLTVTPGGGAQIDVTLRDDFAKLEGKVTGLHDSSGASQGTMPPAFGNGHGESSPTAHIYCVPLPNSSGQFAEFWTSPDGSFEIPEIAPGAYRVLAFDRPQLLPYFDPEAMRAYESEGEVVHLSAGQTQHVQLQVISGEN